MRAPDRAPPRGRVALVDDDPDVVARLLQLLEGEASLEATTDWARINRLVLRGDVDLVLMDLHLPVLRGDRLVEILSRARRPAGRPPLIVLFSSEDEAILRRLVAECGADGCLSKSLRGAELLRELRRLLAARR